MAVTRRSAQVSGSSIPEVVLRLLLLAGVALSASCATVLTVTPIGREAAPTTAGSAECTTEDRLLSRWGEISGTLTIRSSGRPGEFESGVLQLGSPTDVAVMYNDLYLLDAGLQQVLVFDRGSQSVRRRIALAELGLRASVHVDRSLSLYVANPQAGRVLQYDVDGRLRQTFASPSVMSDPIGISVNDSDGRLYVADGLSARVVVFNAQGAVEQVLGAEAAGDFQPQSVRDVAVAPDQLYVSDEIGRRVHYLSGSGRYRYAFGEDSLIAPVAIAIDEHNRVYVADNGDGTIKIYRGGELLSVFGGSNNVDRVRFGNIGGMSYSEGLLYVADPETVAVQIFRVAQPCP